MGFREEQNWVLQLEKIEGVLQKKEKRGEVLDREGAMRYILIPLDEKKARDDSFESANEPQYVCAAAPASLSDIA